MSDPDADLAAVFAALSAGQRIELGKSLAPPSYAPRKYALPRRTPSERLAAHRRNAFREDPTR